MLSPYQLQRPAIDRSALAKSIRNLRKKRDYFHQYRMPHHAVGIEHGITAIRLALGHGRKNYSWR